MNMNDLNDLFKRRGAADGRRGRPVEEGDFQETSGSGRRFPQDAGRKFCAPVTIAALLLLAFYLLSNCYYTLSVDKVAVVSTLGSPTAVTTPGVHFMIPGIQRVTKLSREIQGMQIGYDQYDQSVIAESEMITKDFNFVNVDFYIEYQIVDPIMAYIHREDCVSILRNLAQSYIRDTVGVYNVDEVITTGKAEIQSAVKQKLSERMESENIGLGIVNVTIQDAEPPTAEVIAAFRAVEDAKQGMDTRINEARKYQSEQIPAANARADKLRQDAEAYKQERVSEAEGQTARFNDMYQEYAKYPLITKKRMFYETMEEVLPGVKVIINGTDGTETLLPLEPFSTAESTYGSGSGIHAATPESGSFSTSGSTAGN